MSERASEKGLTSHQHKIGYVETMGDEESESAKSGENGTDDGEMDVRSVAER